jgi:hypothetical protein
LCRRLTNSSSRPAHGWNGCVTRTRGKALRSEGSGAFDESIQRTPGGAKQQGQVALPPRLRLPLRRRADRDDLPLLRRHLDCPPSPMSHPQIERRAQCCLPHCKTASAPQTRIFRGSIARPARTPTDASPPPSRTTTHGSGPSWLARPSMLDSLIPFSGPVYPGAPYTVPRTIPHPHHDTDLSGWGGAPLDL